MPMMADAWDFDDRYNIFSAGGGGRHLTPKIIDKPDAEAKRHRRPPIRGIKLKS